MLPTSLIGETVRVMLITTIGFLVALGITPLWYKVLKNYRFGKQLRDASEAPIFHGLHKAKAGTPTAGGVIIWSTVIVMALVFDLMERFFGGFWGYLNFVDRAETFLPIAA